MSVSANNATAEPANTIDAAGDMTPQEATSKSYTPIKFQSIKHAPAHDNEGQNPAKKQRASAANQESSPAQDTAPKIEPVRAFSPIIFQDINATASVPNDFRDEAASRISTAQKRLSSRGLSSVQLNNQPLVDSKHKRESAHFQPIDLGGVSLNYR